MKLTTGKVIFGMSIFSVIALCVYYGAITFISAGNKSDTLRMIYSIEHAALWFVIAFTILIYPFFAEKPVQIIRYYIIHLSFLMMIWSALFALLSAKNYDIIISKDKNTIVSDTIQIKLKDFAIKTITRRKKASHEYSVQILTLPDTIERTIAINKPVRLGKIKLYFKEWSATIQTITYIINGKEYLSGDNGYLQTTIDTDTIIIYPEKILDDGTIQYHYDATSPYTFTTSNEKLDYTVTLTVSITPANTIAMIFSLIFLIVLYWSFWGKPKETNR
ncbi:MAG: hypothetical protein A2015_07955 [Spirochaetes bacterium GWF1_31_7]|nr:MAG: hypothetical protein A2Y30_02045 [Spirochaetes bacterium GWE1_32_154]OHD46974.1 MAG: hypothetical protein A2015_07955 [Spirochaetes bacterium GWF1_31_7]OHD49754.1 MAG: hypothetical protein A2Y29_06155 [Spirochaetes bacterium GWE2_31_10]OHD75536.1 MAG: hypothetical protein A2355_04915 [Spirochaetes bacterium RIFOXYB1_FULL_32_8]HBD95517.1 hypothetical protein [Spirochaetia bacterium]